MVDHWTATRDTLHMWTQILGKIGMAHCPDWVKSEGYSRELRSGGVWPGSGKEGAFYSYAYLEPEGFTASRVERITRTSYSEELDEVLLPYEAARTADDPDRTVAWFLQTTYEAAADLGAWDRSTLEDDPDRPARRSTHPS